MSWVFSWNKKNTQEANGKKKSIPTSQPPLGPKSPAENPAKTSSTQESNRQITETAVERAGREGMEAGRRGIEAARRGMEAARAARMIRTHQEAARADKSRTPGINNRNRGGR
jgi:hypothetical protein